MGMRLIDADDLINNLVNACNNNALSEEQA